MEQRLALDLTVATNGEEALSKLREISRGHAALPDVFLLDLNLPFVSGLELLDYIKQDPQLRSVNTICFSTSTAPADKESCKALGSDAYVEKPAQLDGWLAFVADLYARQNKFTLERPKHK